jgi:hypothetical protein
MNILASFDENGKTVMAIKHWKPAKFPEFLRTQSRFGMKES